MLCTCGCCSLGQPPHSFADVYAISLHACLPHCLIHLRRVPGNCFRSTPLKVLHASCSRSISTVYRALCTTSSQKVVIKTYHKQKMQPKHHYKLQREVRIMQELRGRYVAELLDSFEDAENVYMILQYYSGGDLFKTMLVRGGVLDEHWVCVEVRLSASLAAWNTTKYGRQRQRHGGKC